VSVVKAVGADFWTVVDAAGRVVAQGRRELCQCVAEGRPVIAEQGDLLEVS